jgi:hypothetical protein
MDGESTLRVSMPHPLFSNRPASGTLDADGLRREVLAVHAYCLESVSTGALQVVVFGGPSHFSIRQDLVFGSSIVEKLDPALNYTIQLSHPIRATVRTSAWGYNAGADLAFFFTRHLGVGALVRFVHASIEVDLTEPSKTAVTDAGGTFLAGGNRVSSRLDIGGLQCGGGLRVRF